MLAVELITTTIPQLQLNDSVGKALQLIKSYRVTHLPVVTEEKFLGLICEDDLLDASNEKQTILTLQEDFIPGAVSDNEHFLQAVNFSNKIQSTIVPVTNEDRQLLGVVTHQALLTALGNFSGAQEIGGLIILEMERIQFSISQISKIVESNEATIFHLNTTVQPETGLLTVTLHLNKKELSAIVASFERYEYNVIYYFGEEKFENEIHSNYRHLMNYLDI
jgi:acetoin utilization protein AcuB